MRRATVLVCLVGLVFAVPLVAAQSSPRTYLPVVMVPDATPTQTATLPPPPTIIPEPTPRPDPDLCEPGIVDLDILDGGTLVVFEFGDWRAVRFFADSDAIAGAFSNEIQGDPDFADFVIDRRGRMFTIYPLAMPEEVITQCLDV